jgi:hypothetical protein
MSDFNDDLETPSEEDLEKCYGSKYLGAVDLGNKKIKTRILRITKEAMQQQGKGERIKFVLYLANIDKPMVLNATNKNILVDELGRNPANWKGAEIGLYTEPTQFGGKPTRGLRLRVFSLPKGAAKVAPPKPKPVKPTSTEEATWDEEDPGNQGENFTAAAE